MLFSVSQKPYFSVEGIANSHFLHSWFTSFSYCKAQFRYKEKASDKEPLRKLKPSAEIDIGLAQNSIQYVEPRAGFQGIFPHVADALRDREGLSLWCDSKSDDDQPDQYTPVDPSALQAMVILAVMANMNLDDPTCDETGELVPFFEQLKRNPNWKNGLHAYGAVLMGIQEDMVSIPSYKSGMPLSENTFLLIAFEFYFSAGCPFH